MKAQVMFIIHWPVSHFVSLYSSNSGFFLSCLLLSGQLRTLIAEAQSRGLRFVYALSPGQDIVFSSSCDLTLLKRKLRQVSMRWDYKKLQECSVLFFSLIHNLISLSRYPTWVARHLPFCLMTSTTPCVRPTARPFLHSLMLRSP